MKKGFKHSEETKKKMSLSRSGSKHHNWKGGDKTRSKRRKEYRNKTHLCEDCATKFRIQRGESYRYCPQCRIISCICMYCINEFFIDRKNYNMGRGKYCSLECANKHQIYLEQKFQPGSRHYAWKGGISSHPKYGQAYKMAYRARKYNADGQYSRKEWESLKKKYDYMCLCCKKTEPEINLTADHIVPLSKGGSNHISNIQPLCHSCNSRKYDKFINYIKLYEYN